MDTAIIRIDEVKRELAEIRDLQDVIEYKDKAKAIHVFAQAQGLSDAAFIAKEAELRARRRAGDLLRDNGRRPGERDSIERYQADTFQPPKLAELGISKVQSSHWKAESALPEPQFEQYIATSKDKGQELSSAAVRRLAKKQEHREEIRNRQDAIEYGRYEMEEGTVVIGDARDMDLSEFPEKFQVIVADPPWLYRVAKGQGVVEDQYDLMTDDDLLAMPVSKLADEDCALFLWGTWPKLPEAMAVMSAWGFNYVTGFPWVKTTANNLKSTPTDQIVLSYGVGYWVRGVSEYILIGRRGKVSAPRLSGFMGILSPNLGHSRKPDSVHQIAEAMGGPYLELFARRARKGWTVFGNEIQGVLC